MKQQNFQDKITVKKKNGEGWTSLKLLFWENNPFWEMQVLPRVLKGCYY